MPRDDHAGARIAEGRKLGGYTQRGFADMIGFSCSQLHQVEGGLFQEARSRLESFPTGALSAPVWQTSSGRLPAYHAPDQQNGLPKQSLSAGPRHDSNLRPSAEQTSCS